MLKLALIGKNLQHSKSKKMYSKLLDTPFVYDFLDYSSEKAIPPLEELLQEYNGISVTSPYKNFIYQQVSSEEEINELKAVNSINFKDGQVIGTNTDYLACKDILKRYKDESIRKVLILGDGDMSRVIKKCLLEIEVEFKISSRKIDSFNLLKNSYMDFDLIINCCSRSFDLNSNIPNRVGAVWDLNYDQVYERRILDKIGTRYQDGKELLLLQAHYSCIYWEISEPF